MNEAKLPLQDESLRLEYEQTVQTLRNWDTLFFNAISSLIVGGTVGSAVALERGLSNQALKLLLTGVSSGLFCIVLLYVLYNALVVKIKVEVLKSIESRLEMIGAYGRPRQASWKTLAASCIGLAMAFGISLWVLWTRI